jgi:hypothetical protein
VLHLVWILLAFLSGCGEWNKRIAEVTGYSHECIGGVLYIQFASGVTVAYDKEGRIKTCE